nr:periplasmic heavy metal sensor [uncultured Desulfobacter sp.]
MKKTLAVLTILIITCAFSASAFAYSQKQGKGKGLKQTKSRACMNLTDEQQKQLRDLHQKFIDDTYEMRADMMTLNQQIRMYMETSDPDPSKLKGMVTEKADLAKDLAVKSLEFALDARKISPELKYMPMGMGRGVGGHDMGYGSRGRGHGYHGFGRGAGFNCIPGMGFDGPQEEPSPENN